MPDVRRVVDELRFYLDSNEAEMTDAIREAARDYADACRQTNQRLRRCGEFLNHNLRSEAIQLAEAEPDLLELVTTLDFPGRDRWEETVGMYSLPAAEPLLMDVAEALNEAYALQEPVKKHLNKHRFLALARAPVKQRLGVLWKLVEHDTSIGTWEADACAMEQVRLREIDVESRDAAKRNDASTLQALVDEIEGGKWIETVPPQLKKAVAQFSREAATTEARQKVQQIAVALESAFEDSDLAQAHALKQHWERLQPLANLDGFDPLLLRVGPVLRWIAEEDAREELARKREHALDAFRQALHEKSTPREKLERLSAAVHRLATSVPESLDLQYQNRLALYDLAEKRRRQLIWATGALSLIVTAVFVGFLVRRALRTAESQQMAQAVEQKLADGRLREARDLVDEQRDTQAGEEWQAAVHALADAEDHEKNRIVEYAGLIESIPNDTSYDDARTKLSRAAELAATAEEKSQVAKLDVQCEERHRNELLGRDKSLREQIDGITADLSRAEAMTTTAASPADRQSLLGEIAQRMTTLAGSVGPSDSGFKPQLAMLKKRLTDLEEEARKADRKLVLLEAIRNKSLINPAADESENRVAEYVALLTTFAKTNPADPSTADFRAVAEEAPVYQGICEWQRLVRRWRAFLPVDVADLRRRKNECQGFLKTYLAFPSQGVIERYSEFLAAMLRREEGDEGNKREGLMTKLRELYSGPLMTDVHVLWDKDDNAYYLKKSVDFSSVNDATFLFVKDFRGETQGHNVMTRQLKSDKSVVAPQCALAEAAQKEFSAVSFADWEMRLKTVLRQVLDCRDIDPFLQYALARLTLEYAASGSEPLAPALKKLLDGLQDPEMDLSTPWMVPNSQKARGARIKAKYLLSRIGDWETPWKESEKTRNHLAREVLTRCTFVGALTATEKGGWTCATRWVPDGNYELVVAIPANDKSPSRWEMIGQAKSGRIELAQSEKTTAFREGRLVLARSVQPSNDVARTSGAFFPETSR